jgi:hypothetical protein
MKVKHQKLDTAIPKVEFMGWIQEGGRGEITGALFNDLHRSGEFFRPLKQMSRYGRRQPESAES